MAKEAKKNIDMPLVILVLAGIAVLGGIIVYSSMNNSKDTGNNKTGDSVNSETQEQPQSTTAADADKLGPNEVKITAANFKSEVEDYKGVVLVDVYASWCPHCQKLAPVITELSNDYKGKVKVGKLDANNQKPEVKENFDFAVSKGLQGYPTVWIYKNGEKVEEFSGEKPKADIEALLKKYL
jgi:thioredoxin 1